MTFDVDTIRTRLREVAFLNSSATITYNTSGGAGSSIAASSNGNGSGNGSAAASTAAAASSSVETFHFSGGIAEFVAYNNRARTPMHDPISVSHMVRLRCRFRRWRRSGDANALHTCNTLLLAVLSQSAMV